MNAKLSRERRHRMREHATQKLSHAYHLDEIAASVATMQSASALEDVAKHVLTRNRDDLDATYVHFFHEKIPSRSLATCTSLAPLDEVIRQRPTDGAPYRTRAVTRIFKDDFIGATTDLTEGLQVCRMYNAQHERREKMTDLVLAREAAREQRTDATVEEKDQPSSLEGQLLFHRAGTYLTMACENIATALHGLVATSGCIGVDRAGEAETPPTLTKNDKEANHQRYEARKFVLFYDKGSIVFYTAFISHFDYTPGQPAEITKAFLNKVNAAANGYGSRGQESRLLEVADYPMTPRSTALVKRNGHSPMHTRRSSQPLSMPSKPVYPLNELFSAVPPPDLPPYPTESSALSKSGHHHLHHPIDDAEFSETLTYHPLLTDALHSLLLCHTLIQTSPKEILRHAYMVARLARISDGFPIFLAARSPARADWVEVVRRARNWIGLSASWDSLCAPAPLPGHQQQKPETAEQRRERNRREAVREALADERVVDEESFRASVRAREMRAVRDEEEGEYEVECLSKAAHLGNAAEDKEVGESSDAGASAGANANAPKRWVQEDRKEYPITTESGSGKRRCQGKARKQGWGKRRRG